jgi:hypothetical protein
MTRLHLPIRWRFLYPGSFLMLILILAGCGGASGGMAATAPSSYRLASDSTSNGAASQGQTTNSSLDKTAGVPPQLRTTQNITQQRLIKTLNVGIAVKDTRQTANDLQAWIGATDPLASSIGTTYNQVSDGVYNITLNFSVQYTKYPKIYQYLSNYAAKDGGHLTSLNESIQDVTNDYVDTQARIKNDQNELLRLRDLMKTSGSLNDVLALEQRISAVEGDIESTQAHLNQLDNQTTMYTVNITIQPLSSAVPPIQPSNGWNVGQTLRDAFSASLAFAQNLFSFIIWLLAFSIYIVPVAFLVILYRRYQARKKPATQPAYYTPTAPVAPTSRPASPQAGAQPKPAAVPVEDREESEV